MQVQWVAGMANTLLTWRPPGPLDRAINAWFDAAPGGWALWVYLGLFVALWTGFQVVAFAPIGLHPDLLEAFAWSRHLSPGYLHPPLSAFVVRAWFAVFPAADWAFHLLAMVNAAVAFLAVDLIARRYLDGDKRLLLLLLLLLTPFYQFHGQRFNANAVLLSTWPIATLCFLRAFETRSVLWSAAAGAAAALAILGKYYSVFLIGGFVIAALADPRRPAYLRSPAPWVSMLVGLVVLAPHLHWLATATGLTVEYANVVRGRTTTAMLYWKLITYVFGALGYVTVPIVVFLVAVRPSRRTLAAMLWPADPDRRMLVILLVAPLSLPILASPVLGIQLTPLWTMPAWFLLPLVLLAPAEEIVARADAVRVAVVVLCVTLAALAAAPVLAWNRFVQERAEPGRAHHAAVGRALTQAWRDTMQRPLAIVAGEFGNAYATTFYSPDHPETWYRQTLAATPWVSSERVRREGWAALCPGIDPGCPSAAEHAAGTGARVVRVDYESVATFLGARGPPVKFVFVLVAPTK